MKPTINAQWLDYKEKVISKDASTTQVRECQLSFYAGAISALIVSLETSELDVFNEITEFRNSVHPFGVN